jgi:hypothetical protein
MPRIMQEVKWGQDNPIENAPVLTEEEKYEIKRRMAILDKILAEDQKAKYKIEIMFGKARSSSGPTPGMVSFWESGAKLHGGGDAKIYMCPGKKLGINDCEVFIPDSSVGYGHLVCPACSGVWKCTQVDGELVASLTMKNWAKLILKYFRKLQLNCDIYLKFARDDIRTMARLEQEKQHGGEKLDKVRSRRALSVYLLKNIIKDTSNGADLLGRFQAFLLS